MIAYQQNKKNDPVRDRKGVSMITFHGVTKITMGTLPSTTWIWPSKMGKLSDWLATTEPVSPQPSRAWSVSSPQALGRLKWTVRTSIAIGFAIKKKIGYVADSAGSFLASHSQWILGVGCDLLWYESEGLWSTLGGASSDLWFSEPPMKWLNPFTGMRQKVFVIAALLSDPDIWVLDEPMTGLDPQASCDLKQMMRQHADRGKTVIFSTHVLEVAGTTLW